jgi:hypothetical protein
VWRWAQWHAAPFAAADMECCTTSQEIPPLVRKPTYALLLVPRVLLHNNMQAAHLQVCSVIAILCMPNLHLHNVWVGSHQPLHLFQQVIPASSCMRLALLSWCALKNACLLWFLPCSLLEVYAVVGLRQASHVCC